MTFPSDQSSLDSLYPFGFVTDCTGQIVLFGRSLQLILPTITIGAHFLDLFDVAQPVSSAPRHDLSGFLGGLVVLRRVGETQAQLRGQVVFFDGATPSYLFALDLSITLTSQLAPLGINLSDLRVGDPFFDFLLYTQVQKINQEKLKEAKSQLEWENRLSKLLLNLAFESQEEKDEYKAYRLTVQGVCQELGWEAGRILVAQGAQPQDLITISPVTIRPVTISPRELTNLHTVPRARPTTRLTSPAQAHGLPEQAFAQRRIAWATESNKGNNLSTPRLEIVAAVAVPIIVDGEVAAVLEFLKLHELKDTEKTQKFLELLAMQLGTTISRQRSYKREREHIAAVAQASKMATLGEIAAGVAHEINNPLHTVTLISQLLKRTAETNKLSHKTLLDQLGAMERSVQRMVLIVSELSEFSRESSLDPFELVNLKRLVDGAVDLCSARLSNSPITLVVAPVFAEWEVECRHSQIAQVILNLLNNAYYAVTNLPNRWIRLEAFDRNDHFEISITDSGPGIPPELVKKIMTPFFTTKPPGKGTGLGLAISSNLVVQHGGTLSVDNTCENTRFVITLPKVQTKGESGPLLTAVAG